MKVNQIKLGAILSYAIIFLSNIVNLLFTPFMLRCLGKSEYGLYALIGSFVGYIVVLDFGLGNTIIRFVAKYRAEKDQKGQENFLAICMLIYSVISILVLLIGIILYFKLQAIFGDSLTVMEMGKAKVMFLILISNLALSLPLNSFSAIMSGHEQFVLPRILTLIRIILRTGILFILLSSGYKAITIVMLDTVLNVCMMLITMFYVFVKMKVRIRLHYFEKVLLQEVFGYSFFVFLNMVVDQVYWRLGQVILGITAGTAAVAVFAVGIQFPQYYMQFSTAISGLFLPRVTQLVIHKVSGEQMTDLFIKAGRIQFIILGYILLAFILFGKQFILLWAGPDYGLAWVISVLIMIPLTVPLFQNVGISILQAKGMHAFRSLMSVVIAVCNILISLVLLKEYGTVGVALGTAVALVVGNIVAINLYYYFKVGLNIPRFFKEVNVGLLPIMFIAAGVGTLTLLVQGHSWLVLLVQGVLFTLIYYVLIWYFGMNEYEKNLILTPLKGIVKQLRNKKLNDGVTCFFF